MCRLSQNMTPTAWCQNVNVETKNVQSFSNIPCEISYRAEDEQGNSMSKTEQRNTNKWSIRAQQNASGKVYQKFKEIDITPGCRVDFRDSNTGTLVQTQYGTGLGPAAIDINADIIEVSRDTRDCVNALAFTNHVCKNIRKQGFDDKCLEQIQLLNSS